MLMRQQGSPEPGGIKTEQFHPVLHLPARKADVHNDRPLLGGEDQRVPATAAAKSTQPDHFASKTSERPQQAQFREKFRKYPGYDWKKTI